MKKSSLLLSSIFSLFVISLFILVGYIAIYKPTNLDLRNWASGDKLETRFVNSSTKIKPNQALTVDIEVNTKGKSYSGIQMAGTISGVDQAKSHLIVSQPSGLNPIFTQMEKDGDNLKFKFINLATPPSPFNSNDSFVKLATLSLFTKDSGEIKITMDNNNSGGIEYQKEFLSISVGQLSYNVEIDDGRGGTPDQGIHRSCNEYCADSRECQDQYSCYYNRCRNPQNLTEESCSDPIVIKTPVVTAPVTTTTQSQTKGEDIKVSPSPSPTPDTTIATVIITSATTSSQNTTSYNIATPIRVSPTPSPTTEDDESASTTAQRNVINLGSVRPSPTPQVIEQPQKGNSLLPILIGAAVVVGIGGIISIILIIKNIQNK
jgi:hypothetical protein